MSFLSSILTPPNTNAAQGLQQQQLNLAQDSTNLLNQLLPALGSEASYSASEEPLRQEELNNLQYLMSPGSNAAREQIFNNQAFGNAARAASQSNALGNTNGQSGAYTQGNNTAINNNAAQAANQYAAQINSPDYALNQAEGGLQALNQGIQMPQLNNMGTLASEILKTPMPQIGEGIGGLLGNVLGSGVSGVLGGIPAGGVVGDFLSGL